MVSKSSIGFVFILVFAILCVLYPSAATASNIVPWLTGSANITVNSTTRSTNGRLTIDGAGGLTLGSLVFPIYIRPPSVILPSGKFAI